MEVERRSGGGQPYVAQRGLTVQSAASPGCWNWNTGSAQNRLPVRDCGFESHPGYSDRRSSGGPGAAAWRSCYTCGELVARTRWTPLGILAAATAALAFGLPGMEIGVLFLLPAIVLLASLLTGRYVGEERLARIAARARPPRTRRRRVARLVLPVRRDGFMPRGGCWWRVRWRSGLRPGPPPLCASYTGPTHGARCAEILLDEVRLKDMRNFLRPAAFAVVATATLALTAPALGHETVTDRGVAVTMHVLPDDEPRAGQRSTIVIVKVKPAAGRALHVQGLHVPSEGHQRIRPHVVLDRRTGKRTTFTFPDKAAYEVTYSGRYRAQSGKTRRFSAALRLARLLEQPHQQQERTTMSIRMKSAAACAAAVAGAAGVALAVPALSSGHATVSALQPQGPVLTGCARHVRRAGAQRAREAEHLEDRDVRARRDPGELLGAPVARLEGPACARGHRQDR